VTVCRGGKNVTIPGVIRHGSDQMFVAVEACGRFSSACCGVAADYRAQGGKNRRHASQAWSSDSSTPTANPVAGLTAVDDSDREERRPSPETPKRLPKVMAICCIVLAMELARCSEGRASSRVNSQDEECAVLLSFQAASCSMIETVGNHLARR
jgi:hypothetical protein